MHLVGIVEPASGLVEQHSVRVPASPKTLHDADEFLSAAAEIIVGKAFLPAEIRCFARILRQCRVPAAPSMADDVERSETARQIVGLVRERRGAGDESDLLGHAGKCRQKRCRLERAAR